MSGAMNIRGSVQPKRNSARALNRSDLSRRDKLLIEQYKEAGTLCRWYENLTRVSWSLYFPAAVALGGYIFASSLGNWMKAVLAITGALISAATAFILCRVKSYYGAYMAELHVTEAKLGLRMYQNVAHRIWKLRVPMVGEMTSKTVPIYLVVLLGVCFVALACWYAIVARRF